MQDLKTLKKHPIHKKIMKTKKTFANDDSFDPDKALSATVDNKSLC